VGFEPGDGILTFLRGRLPKPDDARTGKRSLILSKPPRLAPGTIARCTGAASPADPENDLTRDQDRRKRSDFIPPLHLASSSRKLPPDHVRDRILSMD